MTFAATILTLYPEMFPGPLGTSLAGRALGSAWTLETRNIRDFATDKHRSVDDTPAGGGAGMVLKPDVLAAALDSVSDGRPMLAMTPRGRPLTQARIRDLAVGPGAIILCGRFEGLDERIFEARDLEPVSIGDYVLAGGELGALVILDACVRLLSGVMGTTSSGEEESFEKGLLEYPHYTRPVTWEGPCHGIEHVDDIALHLIAVDLARSPDGRWWVVSDRTQAPSGAGYALENRNVIAQAFPDLLRELKVRPIHGFFDALRDSLMHWGRHCAAHNDGELIAADERNDAPPLIVLLTPDRKSVV